MTLATIVGLAMSSVAIVGAFIGHGRSRQGLSFWWLQTYSVAACLLLVSMPLIALQVGKEGGVYAWVGYPLLTYLTFLAFWLMYEYYTTPFYIRDDGEATP